MEKASCTTTLFTDSLAFPKVRRGVQGASASRHGADSLPADVLAFVDTPQFQRLRELKQLGVTSYIFPGATHDRFQHSVGR